MILVLFISSRPHEINAQGNDDCLQDDCPDGVIINLQSLEFPGNLWRVEDILNVYFENKTNKDIDIYLSASIKEGNKVLFNVTSDVFRLFVNETRFVIPAELVPVEVTLDDNFSALAQEIVVRTGSLPAGKYEICVCAINDDDGACIGSECVFQDVGHPSPPELIFPLNEGVVAEDLPVFSWLPPMPSSGLEYYRIEVVELLDGQLPLEAMESNLRWFFYQPGLQVTSLQYPISDREFVFGTRYAWRIGAYIGEETDPEAIIFSPVWSFTFMGSSGTGLEERFLVNLTSPGNNETAAGSPFFSWELLNLSSQQANNKVPDEDVYYNVKIWKWPDTLDAGDATAFADDLENNPSIDPYFEVDKLTASYLNISEIAPDTLKDNYTYFWKVTGIKDESVIGESEISRFSILSDKSFIEAAKSMLNVVQLKPESKVYGITAAVTPGAIIISEVPSELDTIEVNSTLYLFIIDDEPFSRYGHPVRYAAVDKETMLVTIYEANWFPEVKYVEDPWNSTGTAEVENAEGIATEINMLNPRSLDDITSRPREIADISKVMLEIECGKYVLIIDGGDRNRTNTTDNIASNAARDADSMQAFYERKHYAVKRFSQYWDYRNESVPTIPVDPTEKTGAKFIRDILLDIKDDYTAMKCCEETQGNFELVIYINANSIPSSNKFRIYKPDGLGVCEDIDYFEDMLKYLQMLPQCVKITLFVDANFSGVLVDAPKLDTYLKRGNYEIMTATDAFKTTLSGVSNLAAANKPGTVSKPSTGKVIPAQTKTVTSSARGSEQSFSDIALALENISEQETVKPVDKVNLAENYAAVNEKIKTNSTVSNRTNPNPQFARLKPRDEFSLQFPAQIEQTGIQDFNVIPESSANVILNKANGQVTVFAKKAGEIKVVVTYENGSEEIKPITSRWGDET